mgnify:FL=1
MTRIESPLQDCFYIAPPQFKDDRGIFCETYNDAAFQKATGLTIDFVQDNQSVSQYGVLRGLHFQRAAMAQAKLVRVAYGAVLDVVVDVRPNSKTYGQHFSIELSAQNGRQLFVPKGFAHGFVTLSDSAIFCYKCDAFYAKTSEGGIRYNDATLAIDWHLPEDAILVSDKDKELPLFRDLTT